MAFHRAVNNARALVAAPYTAGSGSLVVDDGAVFGTTMPIYISTRRGSLTLSILEVTGRSGNTLTIGEAAPGSTDVDLLINDIVTCEPVAQYLDELQNEVLVRTPAAGQNDISPAADVRALRGLPHPAHQQPFAEILHRNGGNGIQFTAGGVVIGLYGLIAGAFSAAGEAVISSGVTLGCSSFSSAVPQGIFECRAASDAGGGPRVLLAQNDGAATDGTHRLGRYSLGAYDGSAIVTGAQLQAFAGATWSPSDRSTEVQLVSAWGGTTLVTRIKTTDRPILQAPATAPADSHLFNGSITFRLDESGHNLIVRARYADGTLKTATIPLV